PLVQDAMGKTPRSLKISPLSKGYATLLSLSDILEDRSNALSATDAQRGNAVLQLLAPELIHQRNGQTRTTGRQGMADRNPAPIHVRLVAVQAHFYRRRSIT